MVQRGELEKRKDAESRELFLQREVRERKRKGESAAHWDHARKALSLKVVREREKEWKYSQGTEQEICYPKPLTGRKERVSIPPGFYKWWITESEVLELSAWWCSGEEVQWIPRSRQRSLRGPRATQGELVPLECIWKRPCGLPTSHTLDPGEQTWLLVFVPVQTCHGVAKPGAGCVLWFAIISEPLPLSSGIYSWDAGLVQYPQINQCDTSH